MSNPLRQSLYTMEDCLNGGDFKAEAAVKSLNRIFPAMVKFDAWPKQRENCLILSFNSFVLFFAFFFL